MEIPRILLADADAGRRALLRDVLSPIQGQFVEVATGREAIAAARSKEFAAILVDVYLEGSRGMDGFELASMLRQNPQTTHVPVVFTSGSVGDPQIRLTAYRMGAAAVVLDAPSEPEILRHKVRLLVESYRSGAETQARLAGLERELRQTRDDLVRQKREIEVVRRQATNDLLTGLPNRLLFEDRIAGALIRSRRLQKHLCLAYIDLDGFKAINDTHGTAAGDEVLATVARRLVSVVRASDTVARIGSDEYAVVLEGLDSAAGAEHVGQKILKSFGEPIAIHVTGSPSIELTVGASIGMAMCPDHAEERNDLLMLADMAMYAVKREGGGLRIASARPAGSNVVSAEEFRRRSA